MLAMDKIKGLVNKVDLNYNSGIMQVVDEDIPPHQRDPGALVRPESVDSKEAK